MFVPFWVMFRIAVLSYLMSSSSVPPHRSLIIYILIWHNTRTFHNLSGILHLGIKQNQEAWNLSSGSTWTVFCVLFAIILLKITFKIQRCLFIYCFYLWPISSFRQEGFPGLTWSSDVIVSLSLVKALVFPVVTYGCESWTLEKAEHWRIDAFELWCCRRLLRVPWTARRSIQSILKEITPECSLEGLMLKLKLKYFGHLMWKAWLTGKDPDAGKDWRLEEKARAEDEMVVWQYWLDRYEFELLQELVMDRET